MLKSTLIKTKFSVQGFSTRYKDGPNRIYGFVKMGGGGGVVLKRSKTNEKGGQLDGKSRRNFMQNA